MCMLKIETRESYMQLAAISDALSTLENLHLNSPPTFHRQRHSPGGFHRIKTPHHTINFMWMSVCVYRERECNNGSDN